MTNAAILNASPVSLATLLSQPVVSLPAIESRLDGWSTEQRQRQVLSLGRRHLASLYEAAAGHRALCVQDLVPETVAADQPVVHEGRNSLPVLYRFAKVFGRSVLPPAAAAAGVGAVAGQTGVWGYNRSAPWLMKLAGPGYFVVAADPAAPGELLIDYAVVPRSVGSGWPRLRPNRGGVAALVYGGLRDTLRGVADGVCIGRAWRRGRALDTWFVLCRATVAKP